MRNTDHSDRRSDGFLFEPGHWVGQSGSDKEYSMQTILSLPATLLVGLAMLLQQGGTGASPATSPPLPPPFPSLPDINRRQTNTSKGPQRKIDAAKAREHASELAKLAQSIPPDIDKATKGQLSQDLLARLKQIEKLSKQLRHEIAP